MGLLVQKINLLLEDSLAPLLEALACYQKKANWDYGIFLGSPTLEGRQVAAKALHELKSLKLPCSLQEAMTQLEIEPETPIKRSRKRPKQTITPAQLPSKSPPQKPTRSKPSLSSPEKPPRVKPAPKKPTQVATAVIKPAQPKPVRKKPKVKPPEEPKASAKRQPVRSKNQEPMNAMMHEKPKPPNKQPLSRRVKAKV